MLMVVEGSFTVCNARRPDGNEAVVVELDVDVPVAVELAVDEPVAVDALPRVIANVMRSSLTPPGVFGGGGLVGEGEGEGGCGGGLLGGAGGGGKGGGGEGGGVGGGMGGAGGGAGGGMGGKGGETLGQSQPMPGGVSGSLMSFA